MDEWLRSHPLIYMAQKEPHYFNTDHQNRLIETLDNYHILFEAATDNYTTVGETSVRYLYSQQAVANILNYNKDAKFIVMLRNPIDMVYSWHNQVYFSDMEDIKDFKTAWDLQTQRMQGISVPKRCREVKMLFYGEVCCLGAQLQRLYEQISRDRVHLIFFDDLNENPRQTYQNVLKFLNVANDNKTDFPAHNSAKTYFFHSLRHALPLLNTVKTRLGIRRNFGILEFVRKKNIKIKKRPPLTMIMRTTLKNYFANDIELLSQLTERNLSHWINNGS